MLCWACRTDIARRVQFSALGELFCEDCYQKIAAFVIGLREPARPEQQRAQGEEGGGR